MKITVIGTGYVGLVTGACFAETGNQVICVDADGKKIQQLKSLEIPFYEPGLEELVKRNVKEKRLQFSTDTAKALDKCEIALICVGTPSQSDGSADLQYVFRVADTVAASKVNSILAIKSTVPVGTVDQVRDRLQSKGARQVQVASNPEFLREGSAVSDCLVPDRIVVGTDSAEVAEKFRMLYAPFIRTGRPVLVMDVRSAEMTKYAANAFLAQRISFINEISMLCEAVGANISWVRKGLASDHRIGDQYLFPSVGFGGSCFPKDVRALIALAEETGEAPRLLKGTLEVNEDQKRRFVERILSHFGGRTGIQGKKLAIWGLAFKAKTDDIRESPALAVVDKLLENKVELHVYDPVAMPNVREAYGDRLNYTDNAYETLENADALCVLTEWNQFRVPDFEEMKRKMKTPTVFDGRNLYEPDVMTSYGFTYYSIGRSGKSRPPSRRL